MRCIVGQSRFSNIGEAVATITPLLTEHARIVLLAWDSASDPNELDPMLARHEVQFERIDDFVALTASGFLDMDQRRLFTGFDAIMIVEPTEPTPSLRSLIDAMDRDPSEVDMDDLVRCTPHGHRAEALRDPAICEQAKRAGLDCVLADGFGAAVFGATRPEIAKALA